MSIRKEKSDLTKVTLNLFSADWDFLKSQYTKSGASRAARTVIEAFVTDLRKKIEASQAPAKKVEVEL